VLLRAEAATESALAAALSETPARVLHLATHGVVDPYEPSLSCVAMTPNEETGDDGYWFASEVLEMKLPCELVVLSACETGRGRLERGEGVVGLTRSFLAAGALEVVASLWAVSDESTSRLMDAFYRSMYDSKRSTAESLRAAREELRKNPETAHPFHWAAFVATATR
jgi:CHAT domain-containing protein